MIVDPETGRLVLDKASLTVQAQPREEYVRRDEGHHDLINSQTYLKRGATNKWTPEETDEFWAVSSLTHSVRQCDLGICTVVGDAIRLYAAAMLCQMFEM